MGNYQDVIRFFQGMPDKSAQIASFYSLVNCRLRILVFESQTTVHLFRNFLRPGAPDPCFLRPVP